MKLTPLDIHHKEFRRSIRGYNEEDVDVFLDQVSEEFERLFKENGELKEQVDSMKSKVKQYEGVEHTLQKALFTGQQAADKVQESALKESEIIISDAEGKAMEIMRDVQRDKEKLVVELKRLGDAEDRFRSEFQQLLSKFLDESSEQRVTELPQDIQEAVDQAPEATDQEELVPAAVADDEPVAEVEEPVAAMVEEPTVVPEEPVAVVEEPVAAPEEPVAAEEEPVAAPTEPAEPPAEVEEPAAVIEESYVARAEQPPPAGVDDQPTMKIESASLTAVAESPRPEADIVVVEEPSVETGNGGAPAVDIRTETPTETTETPEEIPEPPKVDYFSVASDEPVADAGGFSEQPAPPKEPNPEVKVTLGTPMSTEVLDEIKNQEVPEFDPVIKVSEPVEEESSKGDVVSSFFDDDLGGDD